MEQFERLFDEFKDHLQHSHSYLNRNFDRKSLFTLFEISLRQDNIYYREKLFEFNCGYFNDEQDNTLLMRIAIRGNNVEMARRLIENGADVTASISDSLTLLEVALKYDNLEMTCMLLYYGYCPMDFPHYCYNDLLFAISNECSKDIQKILVDYISDSNHFFINEPLLFIAIRLKSPIILDLIERGADPNYTSDSPKGTVIAPLYGVEYSHDVDIIRVSYLSFY